MKYQEAEESCMKSYIICTLHQIILGWWNQEGWDGGACSKHGVVTVFIKRWLESLKGRDYSEDQGERGRIILKWISGETGFAGMDWIDLARDLDRWRTLVNTVMNNPVPYKLVNFLTSWVNIFSHKGHFHFMSYYSRPIIYCNLQTIYLLL
jgi:hypothetical protein